ncbi:hypothetical protein KNE206_76990 [Kitasatospora sp. NE20-6]
MPRWDSAPGGQPVSGPCAATARLCRTRAAFAQLGLEGHGGRAFEGVAIRVARHVLAVAAGIRPGNGKTSAPVTRSPVLVAYGR